MNPCTCPPADPCAECGHLDESDLGEWGIYCEGEHGVYCVECEHQYTVSTEVEITWVSPPRIQEGAS